MYIDVILDAEDEEIEKFLQYFVEKRIISKKRGFATINLSIKPFSPDIIEKIINGKLIEFIITKFPELNLDVEVKPPRSSESSGSFSLYELVNAFQGDLDTLFTFLKYSTFRAGKLRLRRDLAEKCLQEFLLNPDKRRKQLLILLKKYYQKVVKIAISNIFTGFIPLKDVWNLTYLFAYSGPNFKPEIASNSLRELYEYTSGLGKMETILPLLLVYEYHQKKVPIDISIDLESLIEDSMKSGTFFEVLSHAIYSQLVFGDKESSIELISELKVNMKELLSQLIEKTTLESRHIALLSILTLFFGCDTLKEFLDERPDILSRHDFWGCEKETPENINLLVDLGSINPLIFKEIMRKGDKADIEKYLKNHLDWSRILGETPHGKKEYATLIKEALIASRDQIIVESKRTEEKEMIYDTLSKFVDLSESSNNEIITLINRLTTDKEEAKNVIQYLLNQEWRDGEKNLVELILRKKEKVKLESKVYMVLSAIEDEKIRKTWRFFTSEIIYNFVTDSESLPIIKMALGNKHIQNQFFKSIEELINYLQVENTTIPLLPEENTISILLTVSPDNELIAKTRFLDSDYIDVRIAIPRKNYTNDIKWLREFVIDKLNENLDKPLEKIKFNIKGIEKNSKFFIAAPHKPTNFSKITLGVITPIRIIKCREECEEKPAEDIDPREIIYQSEKLEDSINLLEKGLKMAIKYGK